MLRLAEEFFVDQQILETPLSEYMSYFKIKKTAAIETQTAYSLQADDLQKAVETLTSTGMWEQLFLYGRYGTSV